jgi:hypothetical protein
MTTLAAGPYPAASVTTATAQGWPPSTVSTVPVV